MGIQLSNEFVAIVNVIIAETTAIIAAGSETTTIMRF